MAKKVEVKEQEQVAVVEEPKTMTILNKGKRAHHVDLEKVIEGGNLSVDKRYHEIHPGDTAIVAEDLGKMLVKNYPAEFADMTPKPRKA